MSTLRKTIVAVVAALLLFLTLGAWSLSSPVGSAPDDDFHLASIWCGQGARDGLCEQGAKEQSWLVPAKAPNAVCYAYNDKVTAACQGPEYLGEGFELSETTRVNAGSHQYPGGYYLITSYFAGNNIAVSTIVIRLFNSALFAVLIVITWVLLPRLLRFALVGSVALTAIPVGLFFTASVNPSSWGFLSGSLLVPALLGWYMAHGRKAWALGGLSAIAALLGFAARGDSAAYVIVGGIAASVLAFNRTRDYWLRALLPIALICIGAALFLSSGQAGLALSGEMGGESVTENPTSKIALLVINLLSLPALWNGVFGQAWGLGWLDTKLPAIVPAIGIFLFSGVLFSALRKINLRRALALTVTGAATVVVPLYILVQSGATVGQEVQPRYVLPLITMFLAVALAPNRTTPTPDGVGWQAGLELSRLQLAMFAFGIATAQSIALFANLRRNVTAGSYNLDRAAEWWWAAGPSPFGVLTIGVFCSAAFMVLLVFASERSFSCANISNIPSLTKQPALNAEGPNLP